MEKPIKKRCRKCDKKKDISEFRKSSIHTDGYLWSCRECSKKRDKEYYNSLPLEVRVKNSKKWQEQNNEKSIAYAKEYRINNPEKRKFNEKRQYQRRKELLPDNFLKAQLIKQGYSKEILEINPEIIEVKRLLIKTKRLCRTSQS